MATKKAPIANKIKYDSAFERTRENMAEFTRGGKAAKLLRNSFQELLITGADKELSNRLTSKCMDILATDRVNGRGLRTVGNGEFDRLRKFDFNLRMLLKSTFFVREKVAVNRATGLVTVTLPAFIPRVMIKAPRTTTHFTLTAAVVAVDFDNDQYDHAITVSEEIAWGEDAIPERVLQLQLPANSPRPFFIALGIEFFQFVNIRRYLLKSGEFNSAAIVEVSKP